MNERLADVLCKLTEAQRQNADIQRPYRLAQVAKRRTRNEKAKDWPKNHAAYSATRRVDIANGRDGVPVELLAEADRICVEWLAEADWRCGYCGKPAECVDRCADHVKPLSRGGKHEPANLKRACRSCNSRKGSRTVWFA